MHIQSENDATFLDYIIDGCGFELIKLAALQKSHANGDDKHRSELCSLYIRENKHEFKVGFMSPPSSLQRKDLRLTVDYPEDLIVCRAVYDAFKHQAPKIKLMDVVEFLDENPDLKRLTTPFCEIGYSSMYL
jgi:spore coat polysaccharide biosynthesis protein SpsF